jgi:hypothetical protein
VWERGGLVGPPAGGVTKDSLIALPESWIGGRPGGRGEALFRLVAGFAKEFSAHQSDLPEAVETVAAIALLHLVEREEAAVDEAVKGSPDFGFGELGTHGPGSVGSMNTMRPDDVKRRFLQKRHAVFP